MTADFADRILLRPTQPHHGPPSGSVAIVRWLDATGTIVPTGSARDFPMGGLSVGALGLLASRDVAGTFCVQQTLLSGSRFGCI